MLNQDYLQHYGVLGMKWGVRKEEEPSGNRKQSRLSTGTKIAIGAAAVSAGVALGIGAKYAKAYRLDTVVKAGKSIQNIASRESRDLSKKFYGATNKADMKKYAGVYGKELHTKMDTRHKAVQDQIARAKDIYEAMPDNEFAKAVLENAKKLEDPGPAKIFKQEIKATKDIKVASVNTSRKTIESLSKNDKEFSKICDQLKEKTGVTNTKKLHNDIMTYGPLYGIEKEHPQGKLYAEAYKRMQKELKANGYGGVVDIHDLKDSGYKSKNPVVFFDGINDSLKMDSVKEIPISELDSLYNKEKNKLITETLIEDNIGRISAGTTGIAAASYAKDKKRGEKKNAKRR